LLLADFEDACATGFDGVAFHRLRQARNVIRVGVVKDSTTGAAHHAPSSLDAWLRDHGLRWSKLDARGKLRRGPLSAEKWVPEFVFELDEEEIARFLAAFWDCDGHVGERSAFIKTISQRLAIDIQTLLLRLGVRSSIYESTYHTKEGLQ